MNFKDGLISVELVLESGGVPLLVGESGIGKTALIKELCKKNQYYSVVIDGNLLKEGEIGGLPVVEEYEVFDSEKRFKKKRTVYAIHGKLQEIEQVAYEEPNKKILLFVDEINRCEHTVQQELMNIILNREINGFKLPGNVLIIAAMNPSNKYNDSDYMVVEMDPAQENRFVWIEIESDVNSWIDWGMERVRNDHNETTRIDEVILDFISSFPQYLHTPKSSEQIKATPRSWERVSDTYRVFKNKEEFTPQKILFNVVKGNVGSSIAQEFCAFIENSKDPLIKPGDLFKGRKVSDEIKKKISEESHSRLYLIAKNALRYIETLEMKRDAVDIFSELLQLYPPDLKLGIMKEIRSDYIDTLYKVFMDNEKFIEGYFALHNVMKE